MIQDIHPHHFENTFVVTQGVQPNDYIFRYQDNSILLKCIDGEYSLPQLTDFQDFADLTDSVYLFTLNNTHCHLAWQCPAPKDIAFSYHEISLFRNIAQKEIAWVSALGHQLMTWLDHNKFCGKCGSATQRKTDERAVVCTHCQHTVYPKISPAIIVAIVCNNKILLAHNANFQENFYSLVAGYADIGESLEACVAREVKEEVGIDVKRIKYYGSQPWPFSGSMMIGYIAEADDTQPICVDGKEIADAQWFLRSALPNHPPLRSIAGEMIELFEKNELHIS